VPLTNGGIGIPMSIGVQENGAVLVADLERHRIWKVPPEGGEPALFAEAAAPRALFVDREDRVWVVSHGKDQILRFDPSGKEKTVIVAGRPFEFPSAIAVDERETAYVCDTYGKAVWKVSPKMKPERLPSAPDLKGPVALALAGQELLIVDPRQRGIVRVALSD
jgi:sugar lactone lactonase YvrE